MKLCLIGSSRFKQTYDEYNAQLTLAGHVVYSIAVVSSSVTMAEAGSLERTGIAPEEPLTSRQKEVLDLVHLRKILESEAVVVITNKERYVGDSTRRELAWAQILGRTVFWTLSEVPRECYPKD